MLLLRLAQTSTEVAATSSRKAKTDTLAATLADLAPAEVEAAVGFLTGAPRQGALGVGWATVARLEVAPAGHAELEVLDLDELLTAVQATTGPGSTAARDELLTEFLSRATSTEHELVRRILIGDLRQGALAGVVTDAVAKAAGVTQKLMRRAVMLQGDLGRSATIALTEGTPGLAAVDLEVGRPIQPMLASTAADIGEAMAVLGQAQVEWKLDGARIQVHRDGDAVSIYTRNLNDVTDRLPQVVDLVRQLPCRSAVLDGEVIGFFGDTGPPLDPDPDPDTVTADQAIDDDNRPQPFQTTMSALGSDAGDGDTPARGLRAFFFDLMYLDGTSLIDEPLNRRSTDLDRLAGPYRIPALTTNSPAEARAHLDAALEAGHEGVMAKAVDGPYEAGRRGKSWRKIKPVHTLDLVVLAAEWGHGRRQGWLSNLHLGARDPAGDGFVMVGKTFKGLTDELLTWQTERFLTLETHRSSGGHVVHVAPELVVEIALDGAQTSTRYSGGVALRFARVRAYRPDRGPETADTLDAVRALL